MKFIQDIIHEIDFEYTRSRGAGGQHVNRTNSAALLKWNPGNSAAFEPARKELLMQKLGAFLTKEGEIVIRSEEFRDQIQNKKRCLEKLDLLIEQAFFVAKKRFKTKPTKSAKRKRVDEKKHRAEFKQTRRKVSLD